MAIQYSGGPNINTTFTTTTGTRLEIVNALETILVSAGWTVISGSGTSNVLLESATTPAPQSLVCRVQIQDTGSGNCAQVKFRNQNNTKAQTNPLYLLPAVGKVYRVIANKYQFFCFASDSVTVGRTLVCGGVPYLPSFLQGVITEAIWCQSNSNNNDSATTHYHSFRTASWCGTSSNQCSQWQVVNGNAWEVSASFINHSPGCQQLMVQSGSFHSINLAPVTYRWHDGSHFTYEPLIAWGLTGSSDEGLVRGQLWDACMLSGAFVADQTTTFDANNWWVYTNNSYTTSSETVGATLLLKI